MNKINTIINHKGNVLTNKALIVEAFRNYFMDCFNIKGNQLISNGQHVNSNAIEIPTISTNCVLTAVRKLKSHTSIGCDLIPNYVIKACSSYLAPSLADIFNLSLKEGIYPDEWKAAYIVPIHKREDSTVLPNYRPITILNTMARLFESIVCEHLQFNLKHVFKEEQHGFIQGKSVVTNLCQITNTIQSYLFKRSQYDVIYIDLAKAFDSVRHSVLLNKLNKVGLSPRYVKWFKSYLSGRRFRIKINNNFRRRYN